MKAYLRDLISPAQNKLVAIHTVCEYLQVRILQSLGRAGAMQTLAFHGGTSLRVLYGITRYSEDLDFALEPNLSHLNQNLRQSGWTGSLITSANWHAVVREQVRALSWSPVLEDVEPFVMDLDGLQGFNQEGLLGLLN
jgi:Nucleotidyl transferase AbiEii toxin, Type IV TA system